MVTLKFEFSGIIIKDFVLKMLYKKMLYNFSLKPKPKVALNKATLGTVRITISRSAIHDYPIFRGNLHRNLFALIGH